MTTPRPWKVTYGENGEVYSIDSTVPIAEDEPWHNGKAHIVETDSGYYGPVKDDAELIVTAVNTFDAAREALQAVVDARWDYKWKNDRIKEWKSKMCDAVDKCELVLAQMEGK